MATAPIKLRTTFNLQCYNYEGVEAIKASLLTTKAKISDEYFQIVFQLIASPEYKAELVTLNKNGGVERVNLVLKLVEQEIKSQGGIFKIVSQPTLIGSTRDDIDKEQIIADANKNEDDENS